MSKLHPETEPYDCGLLEVAHGNRLYWETVGTPTGTPAVYLHGGPGSGCTPGTRRLFDPSRFRAVLLDQRGCGRSTPSAADPTTDLSTNTTGRLVDDLERLRQHLGIDRWLVAGVSWGVSLGLAYAQQHPERVSAMVLGAVTAGTRREVDWITRDMGRVFPREWEQLVSLLPEDDRASIPSGYARLLDDPDPAVRERAARAWCAWEDTHVSLMPGWTPDRRYEDPAFRHAFARLVTHYWSHDCFLRDGQLLEGMTRLADVPAVLVHGRHDVSGPLVTAWQLHRAWPGSRLVVLGDAGHGGSGFSQAMVQALDGFG